MKWVLGIIGVLVLVAMFTPSGPSDATVAGAAHHFVEKELARPDSASFGGYAVEETARDTWQVSGTVTARNGFNAPTRYSYALTIRAICTDRISPSCWSPSSISLSEAR